MNKISTIHFTGIKGVGMTPLAIIAKEAGISITGSDVDEDFITEYSLKKAGISVFRGFNASDIGNPDLLITSGAHGGQNNPQAFESRKRKIPVWSQGQAVGEFMKGDIFGRKFKGISISGSHGKTTVTSIVATIFKESGLDPSYLIGTSSISSLDMPGHFGNGKFFIAEADEYATDPDSDRTAKMLWQHPEIALITNIEFDHPDIYKNIEDVRNSFVAFSNSLKKDSILVVCIDDKENKTFIRESGVRNLVTYGFSPSSDYKLDNLIQEGGETVFHVNYKNTILGKFFTDLPGEFNALNLLGSIVISIEAGISVDKIQSSIKKYKGAKRRFEYIGTLSSGAKLFDDYAHHPTEIKKTLRALSDRYKDKKIVCIFQPHTYSRTKALFDDFIHSFSDADEVIISDIYSSLREVPDPSVGSEILTKRMKSIHNSVAYMPALPDVIKYVSQENYDDDFIVISMGAGDIYKIKDSLDFSDDN